MFGVLDRRLGGANRCIDVTDGVVAQAPRDRVILLARHIRVHLAQQFQRLVQPARAILG